MHVVHWAGWAPRQSGMFESVKDQVKYERKTGLQSDLAEPDEKHKAGRAVIDDGWLSPISWEVAKQADIHVLHAWIPPEIRALQDKKKFVAVLHGPNEHMLLKEWITNRKEQAFNLHIDILWKYDATVVLNKHEYDILKLYDEHERLHYIPNSIDLERYQSAEMVWKYDHHPAILSCDVFRIEKLPAHILWAMPRIAKKIPEARLNLYCLPLEPIATYRNMFCRAKGRELERLCETIQLENKDLRPFMRGGDIGFNNNISGIASRVSMEMMAIGIPVISYGGDYTTYHAKIWDLDSIAEQVEKLWNDMIKPGNAVRQQTLQYAKDNFDREKEVMKYVELYKKLLEKKSD